MQKIKLTDQIPIKLNGLRLDQALARLFPDYSRARLQHWIEHGQVLVDDQIILRPKHKIQAHQTVLVQAILSPVTNHWEPQAMALDILYADSELLILNKPSGLVVHPAAGNPDHTLVNALLHYDPQLNQLPRAGIVHRLDKETSGIMVVARTLEAQCQLVQQIQQHEIKREYQTIVNGLLTGGGTVNAPIGRHPTQRLKMAVIDSGKPAVTHYRIVERFRAHTQLKILLETGRTHQIRVHMTHIGHPIVGDPVYGGRLKLPSGCTEHLKITLMGFKRQALHAQKLTLTHPKSGELLSWTAPLPKDFIQLMESLRQ